MTPASLSLEESVLNAMSYIRSQGSPTSGGTKPFDNFLSEPPGGWVLRALRLRSVLRDQGLVRALSSRVVRRNQKCSKKDQNRVKDSFGPASFVGADQPSHDAVAIHKNGRKIKKGEAFFATSRGLKLKSRT